MDLYKTVKNKGVETNEKYHYNILVVEDDDVGYILLREILSSYPVKLFRAVDGKEAIDCFHGNKDTFDLVLMDIRLPKINGYEATQKIKEINPSIPIVAITAYAHSQGILDCYSAGCDDFIAKPFDINKIVKLVENYLVFRN